MYQSRFYGKQTFSNTIKSISILSLWVYLILGQRNVSIFRGPDDCEHQGSSPASESDQSAWTLPLSCALAFM